MKVTDVAPVRFVPFTVTLVPAGPLVGAKLVIVGEAIGAGAGAGPLPPPHPAMLSTAQPRRLAAFKETRLSPWIFIRSAPFHSTPARQRGRKRIARCAHIPGNKRGTFLFRTSIPLPENKAYLSGRTVLDQRVIPKEDSESQKKRRLGVEHKGDTVGAQHAAPSPRKSSQLRTCEQTYIPCRA